MATAGLRAGYRGAFGEGADELFAGYAYYEDVPSLATFKRIVPRSIRRSLGKFVENKSYFKGRNFLLKAAEMPEKWFTGQAFIYRSDEIDDVVKPEYAAGPDAFEPARRCMAACRISATFPSANTWI